MFWPQSHRNCTLEEVVTLDLTMFGDGCVFLDMVSATECCNLATFADCDGQHTELHAAHIPVSVRLACKSGVVAAQQLQQLLVGSTWLEHVHAGLCSC